MKSFMQTIGLIAVSALLGACVALSREEAQTRAELLAAKGYEMNNEIRSIPNYRISGWEYLDSYSILLDGGDKQKYLVSFLQRCTELRRANVLTTTSKIQQLTTFDTVLVRQAGGGFLQGCRIDKLYSLRTIEQESGG